MKRALISVYNKEGIVPFAKGLQSLSFDIISSGGTAKVLAEADVKVQKVEEVTGFPEMLEGRVKTLHPLIHAGILGKRNDQSHMNALKEQGINTIDLVVVNLYPFKETISKPNATPEEIIENIDIGGPSLIRAAAKNYHDVAVIVNPARYSGVLEELKKEGGNVSHETKEQLAKEAFEHTAQYDALIASYFQQTQGELLPEKVILGFEKKYDTRYGDNPHQKAAFYKEAVLKGPSLANAIKHQGKELSFNNINDGNSALELIQEFQEPAAAIIKHTNPCGIAQASVLEKAFENALACDEKSAFGGVIALNKECDAATATRITAFFNEMVIAPSFTKDALEILKEKEKVRVLKVGIFGKPNENARDIKKVQGGILVQEKDSLQLSETRLEYVSERKPSASELEGLLFGWKVVKHVKSNAIVLCNGTQTVGIGAGQMSRVDAVELAIKKAGEKAKNASLASDAFFPFPDNIELAANAGITAVIETGGSVRSKEIIAAANEKDIALVFTGIRHFKH